MPSNKAGSAPAFAAWHAVGRWNSATQGNSRKKRCLGSLTKPVSIHLSSFATFSMIGRHAINYSRPVVRLGEFDFYETEMQLESRLQSPKGKVPAAYTIVYTSTDVNADRDARAHGNSRSSKLSLHRVDLFLGSTGKPDATLPLCRCKTKVLPAEKLCQFADRKTRTRSRGSVAG